MASMRSSVFITGLIVLSAAPFAGAAVLFADNFNTGNTANFDGAPTAGRLSGTLASDIVLRSWGAQESIDNNQLLIPLGVDSGVRFENAAGPFGATNRYNWAGGSASSAILSAGGFVVSFDWAPPGNTSTNWISFQVGTINGDSGNLTNDDYGILFRQNGNTERFDNSVNLGAGGAFVATPGGVLRHVEITYLFNSFADGANVTATSTVDGVQVASDTFQWDSNGGQIYMELGNNDAGNRVDNLTISTVPEPSLALLLGMAGLGLGRRRRQA
jgi:hypothetical protein